MKIRQDRFKYFLISLMLCSTVFDAYCLFTIGTFSFTISFMFFCIFFVYNILFAAKKKVKRNVIIQVLTFGAVGIMSIIFSPCEYSVMSFLLLCFYLIAYFFSEDELPQSELKKIFHSYWILLIIIMIYGIYQFFAYRFGLPFQEIEIFQRVQGFNTTNQIRVGSMVFQRAHSICLEPSIFSQLCALGIALTDVYCERMLPKVSLIGLFCIAIVLSFSGTGIVLLGILLIAYIVKNKKYNVRTIALILILAVAAVLVLMSDSEIVNYLFNRLFELRRKNTSASIRFVYPYLILFLSMTSNLFGLGPGTNTVAGAYLGLGNVSVTAGYAKAGIEYGIFGLIIFASICISICKKRYKEHTELTAILLIYFVLLNILNDFFLQAYFWIFLIILNSFSAVAEK